MNDIREGSIDLAGQTIDLEDLDDAYARDYDTEGVQDYETEDEAQSQQQPPAPGGLPPL